MEAVSAPITLTIPPQVASELPSLANDLTERMHELLERNTDGALEDAERRELETLVHMAQFAQLLATLVSRPVHA